MLRVVLIVLLLQASPPAGRDSFGPGPPSHVFLVTDLKDGSILREDAAGGDADRAFAPGGAGRLLLAAVGMEKGLLDAGWRIPCDSRCWADGSHGEPTLPEAVAFACDTWFHETAGAVAPGTVAAWAKRAGFTRDGGEWTATARQWTAFWRRLVDDRLGIRSTTASNLLAAAGMAVTSPRGAARILHDPARRVRAVVGGDADGTWVTGTVRPRGGTRWAFALHVPGTSTQLAVARAAALIDETVRRYEQATSGRGRPLPPLDDDR